MVPAISSSPASGFSRPATQRKVVVLPQPLGPSRTQNSFSVTSRSIPRSASTRPRRLSNHFLSPRMLIKEQPCEDWSNGVRECWNIGILEFWNVGLGVPLFHYSNVPSFHSFQFPEPNSPPKREKPIFKIPTTSTAKSTSSTPNAATCGTQPLPQNCHTMVEMTRFLRVPSARAIVTSRYDNMLIQIQLLKMPAATNGRTIRRKTRGVEAPDTLPASSSSRCT